MSSGEFIPPDVDVCFGITAASLVSHDFESKQTTSDSGRLSVLTGLFKNKVLLGLSIFQFEEFI